ncbi:hypothetical protein [Oceanobacillus massiliensis]|uniref:hypothetical protein n=1 Tax=Oceanobacillus massiliensis TaxID=1465765 RepID=UPI00028A24D1|nr:hypothetical protein [Oceanobacillus massiliensis]
MNSKLEESNDQAEELRNLVEELENEREQDTADVNVESAETDERREVDILNLPPRKEIHSENTRMSLKISKPLSRFLSVILILIIIFIGAYYFLGNEWF